MARFHRRHALGLAAATAVTPVLVGCDDRSAYWGGRPGSTLVATADVPVGGGVVLGDQGVVVTQPQEGEFKAFSNICTHQSCPITKVTEGNIECTCHFSKFSIEDGSVVDGPAEKSLPEMQITVSGDSITLG